MWRKYTEGRECFGRSMPAAMIFEMARCTLRACRALAVSLLNSLTDARPDRYE